MQVDINIHFDWSSVPTDIILEDEETNKQIHAHRLLLISCSPYFKEMFNGNFSEANTKVVKLSLPGKQLETIVGFIYKNKQDVVTADNIIEIYTDADFLQMVQLCDTLSAAMITTPHNIFNYILKALQYHQEALLCRFIDKLKEIWDLVCLNQDVSLLTPQTILDIVTSQVVKNKMNSDKILMSLIHYAKVSKLEESIKSELFSSLSLVGVSTKTLEDLATVYPEFKIPIVSLVNFSLSKVRKTCTICKKEVDLDSPNTTCATMKVHCGEINKQISISYCSYCLASVCLCSTKYRESKMVSIYACCSNAEPCTVVDILHTFS